MSLNSRDYYRPGGFGGFSFFPPVIKSILIANVAVFVLMILAAQVYVNDGITFYDYIMKYFALNPIGGSRYMGASFLPWQLITYQFMHDINGISHILFNMFILWMFGMEIENLWGSRKFLFYYLLAGVGAGLAQLLLGGSGGPTIGASGAVYGVMIAFAMFFPDRYIFLYFLLPIKAKYFIAIMVVFEFMSVGEMSFVAHTAHLGGALTGVIFILLDRRNNFDIDGLFNKIKSMFDSAKSTSTKQTTFKGRRPFSSAGNKEVQDAEFFEFKEDEPIDQSEIDRILDKISQSGYQNLTEKEKRILFEASKKN